MSIESALFDALKGLVSNRVYPDVAPNGAASPHITYQQIGGEVVNYLDNTIPGARNAHFQIDVWGTTRASVTTLAQQVETAMRQASTITARPVSAPMAHYEDEVNLYGSNQDFSVWEGS